MLRKKLASNSFQQRVVDFLETNAHKKFTAKEILDEINKTLDSPKTVGSMSGTLAALYKDGWVIKSDDYPTRYSCKSTSYNDISSTPQASTNSNGSTVAVPQELSLESKISSKISDIKYRISRIDNQIGQLQKERALLESQLEFAEGLLLQDKQ